MGKPVLIFFKKSNSAIALVAQKTANSPRSMVVIDIQVLKKVVVVA